MIVIKPNICSFCRSEIKEGKTEFIVHLEGQVVVLTDVPAWICINCKEAYFDFKISTKIDEVIENIRDGDFRAKPIAAGEISLADL
ncbi:MAG: type II toxin-antitoxin system MqsA family antitoxin [Candidatus Heimdallarchaeota archaeon]|nr:type II toxin-antitoxin system MqsA family antitoxin [Candidatus Heimdallarchaeota archaeon]